MERGSSVWRAALDVMIRVALEQPKLSGGDRQLTLHIEKARDFAPPPPIVLALHATGNSVCVRSSTRRDEILAGVDKANPVFKCLLAQQAWTSLHTLVSLTQLRRRLVQKHLQTLMSRKRIVRRQIGRTAEFRALRPPTRKEVAP